MTAPTSARLLGDVAHARAGDKGDVSILMVHVFDGEDWASVATAVTVPAIAQHFAVSPESVSVTPLEQLRAFTVVVRGRLSGGVTRSPRADPHGKALSGHLLDLPLREG